MKRIKNLQTENLAIDYLTLNYKFGKPRFEHKTLIKFFHAYKFNCYWIDANNYVKIRRACNGFVENSYEYKVNFVLNSNQANSQLVLIQFSGRNAYYFYENLKTGCFRWDFFSDEKIVVSRFDLNYSQSTVDFETDLLNELIKIFYQESVIKFKKRYPRGETQILKNTLCLGTRTGDYFLRVYRKVEADILKYELEIKKYKARHFSNLLIQNEFEQLEKQIIEDFYNYLKIALYLGTELTNWLCIGLRKTDKQKDSIVSNYLINKYIPNTLGEQKYFYQILQFLSFTKQLNFKLETLNGVGFYSYVFPLSDFAKWIGRHPLSTYQRLQLLKFFNGLIELPPDYGWFVKSNEVKQMSYISPFPILVYKQEKNQSIEILISVSKLFYSYQYPFYLPTNFIKYNTVNDFRVKYQIIQAMVIDFSIVKTISLDNLFSNKTSNKNKKIIKTNLIKQLKSLHKKNLIEKELELNLVKNRVKENSEKIEIDKVTPKLLNSYNIIIFYEKIE